MLLEAAVADSYAIAFEFVRDPKSHGLVNDLATYQQNPKYKTLAPSIHTDDTQRSIAVAKWILDGSTYFDVSAFIQHLQIEFNQYPRDGYSRGFQALMEEMQEESATTFLRRITTKKDSNGSIMGVLPCGYLPDPVDVRLAASIQAISTHSYSTIPYAQMLAMSAHYFIHRVGDRSGLFKYLETEVEGKPHHGLLTFCVEGPTGMGARETALAVINLVLRYDSLSEILYKAVDLGGDTDSVAALAVGLGSCCAEIENDLPEVLIDGVEEGSVDFKKRMADIEEWLKDL